MAMNLNNNRSHPPLLVGTFDFPMLAARPARQETRRASDYRWVRSLVIAKKCHLNADSGGCTHYKQHCSAAVRRLYTRGGDYSALTVQSIGNVRLACAFRWTPLDSRRALRGSSVTQCVTIHGVWLLACWRERHGRTTPRGGGSSATT